MPFPSPFPGVRVWPLAPDSAPTIRIEPSPHNDSTRALAARVESAWSALLAANPRLFDGPILSVVAFDPGTSTITARRESYKWLAVQDTVPTGVHQLGVTGIITAHDASGEPHVLLGRRAPDTRTHGGLWELAPSGGIDPPPSASPDAPTTLGRAEILSALSAESREELGLDLDWSSAAIIALYRDDLAHNDDLVARLDLPTPIDAHQPPRPIDRAWEYLDTRWLPLDAARAFDSDHSTTIRPPTRALMRHLGWV